MPTGIPKNGVNKGWFKKGQIPWDKEIGHSEETKRLMSGIAKKRFANKENHPLYGKHHSVETRKKLSFIFKGKKLSDSHREKIRVAMQQFRGMNNPMRRKNVAEKVGQKIRGSNHYGWKGGITPLKKTIRDCAEYARWRTAIFTRDSFTCVLCGAKNGNGKSIYFEADHYPKPFAEILLGSNIKNLEEALGCSEFWNLDNGRTICLECHNKTKTGRPRNAYLNDTKNNRSFREDLARV